MTVISDSIRSVSGVPDDRQITFSSTQLRDGSDSSAIVSTVLTQVFPVDGDFTVDLDPGPAEAVIRNQKFKFVVPESGPSRLWPLIEAYIPQPPMVVDAAVAARDAAMGYRDDAQQILDDVAAGAVPDTAVAAHIESGTSETRTALDGIVSAAVAPKLNQTQVDSRVTTVGDARYATPASVTSAVAPKLDQTQVDARVTAVGDSIYAPASGSANYAPVVETRVPATNLPTAYRTAAAQPFTAGSVWNTPIGNSAAFEASTDTATANFLTASPAINDTLNGYGFFVNTATASDPLGTGSYDNGLGQTGTFTHRMPYDPVISSGSDGSMRIVDGRWAYDYWKTVKVDDITYTATSITRTDLLGSGINTGTRAAKFPTAGGLIRTHEVAQCYIPHALCISIPPSCAKRGYVWPASAEDAVGVTYSGQVPMGAFLAIPPSVNIASLGLSPEGVALAACLQDYGMYVGDTSGSAAISVDGEAAVQIRPALERMRTDWIATIFPLLRLVTNVGTTAGAPGTRKVAPTGPVAIEASTLATTVDRLQTRLRLASGSVITSFLGKYTGASISQPTDCMLGGSPVSWAGTTSQFTITDGVISRVASPDGSSRALLLPSLKDAYLSATIAALPSTGTLSFMARAVDISNGYRFTIAADGSAAISKNVAGTVTTLPGTNVAAGTIGVGTRVGIMVYGPRIFAIVNGDVVAEAVDTSLSAGTSCGFTFPSSTTPGIREVVVRSVPRLQRKA